MSILAPKSFQKTSKIKSKPSKTELGKPCGPRARPGGPPGVSRGELGVSGDSFWIDFGVQNSSQINEKKQHQKTMRLEKRFLRFLFDLGANLGGKIVPFG